MTVIATPADATSRDEPVTPTTRRSRGRGQHSGVLPHAVIIVLAILWILPVLWTLYTSLRPLADTNANGYFSLAHSFTFSNFVSSSGELYDSTFGIVVINIAFQTGFCVFVLSNFMRTIPEDIGEAAMVDGASIWTQYWRITMPLCRPALAALATLLTTWIYNDFFWALTLMSTGSKRPITSALNNLQGQFAVNNNLLAAGALIIAVPTLAVYVTLQKQFVAGLTLGSTKG